MPDEESQYCADSQHVSRSSSRISSSRHGTFKSRQVSAQLISINVFAPPTRTDSPQILEPWPLYQTPDTQHATSRTAYSTQRVAAGSVSPTAMLSVPPPPPPPFPPTVLCPPLPPVPPFMVGNISNSPPEGSQSDFANELEQEQEAMQDAREEVLGARFRLQALRKKLRDLRQQSGAKDGSVFSKMRQVIHERDFDVLPHLEDELNKASALRDSLGLLEADYEDAEVKYNTLEWKYSRREAKFAEGLLVNDFVPNQLFAPRKETTREIADLTRFAGELPINSFDSTLTERFGPTYSPEAPESIPGQVLSSSHEDLAALRRASSLRSTHSLSHSIRRHNDRRTGDVRLGWVEKLKRIDTWLLEMLSGSRWEQARLRERQGTEIMPYKTWWRRVEENWKSNFDVARVFHTGDSTITDPDDNDCISTSTVDNTGSASSEIEVSDRSPLRPGNQFLDVLDDDWPADIEPRDLEYTDTREDSATHSPRQDLLDRTDHSMSIGYTISRRTSASSKGHASATSLGQSSDNLSCALDAHPWSLDPTGSAIAPHDGDAGASDQDGQSVPTTPTQRGQDEDSSVTPRLPPDRLDLDVGTDNFQAATVAMNQILTEHKSERSFSDGSIEWDVPQTEYGGNIISDPGSSQVSLPPSTAQEPSNVPVLVYPCPPLIRVTTSKHTLRFQFPFPFLRLTSNQSYSCSHSEHQVGSRSLPFVSYRSSRIHLPGPAPHDL